MANGDAKPVTYKGYDSDDKFVYEQTGQNADQYIDMKVVKAKMSDIYDAMNTNLNYRYWYCPFCY